MNTPRSSRSTRTPSRTPRARDVSLKVLPDCTGSRSEGSKIRRSRMGPRRAAVLIGVHVLFALHLLHWRLTGRTVSPVEPSESMYALEQGAINAGVIFFTAALLATAIFGRFFCGWGCHLVALQDLCGWMMKKIGVRPKPFRSRLLIYFPLALALYMFVWPTTKRIAVIPALHALGFERAIRVLGGANPFPGFSNQLLTEDFWATFASIPVAIPFLFICGFATVYFLGAKGFCTYGCPYGGFFAPIEQLAPGRILVDADKCHQCGHCTAVCTSNVRIHEEIREFGMVVDPGCMKCMDCVSVCPNDALSFGFRKPAIARHAPAHAPIRRKYDLTWSEEIVLSLLFVASFFAWRGVYGVVPMLMAAGVAGCVTFLAWKLWSVARRRDVRILGAQLKRAGRVRPAGAVFAVISTLVLLSTAQSLAIRTFRLRGDLLDANVLVSRDVAMSGDPNTTPANMKALAGRALSQYRLASGWRRGGVGLTDTPNVTTRMAWLHVVRGEWPEAISILQAMDARFDAADTRATDLATILALDGQEESAVEYLERILADHPRFTLARGLLVSAYLSRGELDEAIRVRRSAIDPNETDPRRLASSRAQLAALLMQGDRTPEALEELEQAAKLSPKDASIQNDLAVALFFSGRADEAIESMRRAAALSPSDALVRIRLSQMLSQVGRNSEAQDALRAARELNPSLFDVPEAR